MKLYITSLGYVGTQAEIPRGEPVNVVDVPVDKAGLIGYLNSIALASIKEEYEWDPYHEPAPAPAPEIIPSGNSAWLQQMADHKADSDNLALLENILWEAPLPVVVSLNTIIAERIRELL